MTQFHSYNEDFLPFQTVAKKYQTLNVNIKDNVLLKKLPNNQWTNINEVNQSDDYLWFVVST